MPWPSERTRAGTPISRALTRLARPLTAAWVLLGLSSVTPPVLAQDVARPGSTQVASGRADHVTRNGETVPGPDRLDPKPGSGIQRRTREQERDDAVTREVCVGCLR